MFKDEGSRSLNIVQTCRRIGVVDAQIITSAALDVLDDVGLDKLSMRLVAERLGVQVGGLYYYVASRAALLRAVADELCDRALSEFAAAAPAPASPAPPATWAAAALDLCCCVRAVLNRHRDSARVLAASPLNGSLSALTLMDRLIAILEAGIAADLASLAADTLMAYVTGFVLQEQSGIPERFPLTLDELAARFPRIVRAVGEDEDEKFAVAVNSIIAGFSARP
jgi:TetR/AcrR family tetracycline transcriptional repressor